MLLGLAGAVQPVSISLCCISNRRGRGGCCETALQQKCIALLGKWGKTSCFLLSWGCEHRYVCPLGCQLWCCMLSDNSPPGHPKTHLFHILLLKLCSSLSFNLLFFFSALARPFCQHISCLQMRAKRRFGGEERSYGHFWASDKRMGVLAALSNHVWWFCDVGCVMSHLGERRVQTHPLTYFPEMCYRTYVWRTGETC